MEMIPKKVGADHGPLSFPAVAQLVAKDTAQNSPAIAIPQNANSILIASTYDANNVTAPIRCIYVDHSGVEYMSAAVTPANTANAAGARFHGELVALPTFGAKSFKIRLDDVPTNAGDVSLFGKAV